MATVEDVMRQMNFSPFDTGPYVTELRGLVARQVADGMVRRSAGTWARDDFSAEERAKAFLAAEWSMANGHCYQTECLDCFPINRHFSTKDMRWHYEFRPNRIAPWLRDQIRVLGYHVRIFRDRMIGRTNPFI